MSSVWKRIADVAKATAHEALNKLEDPVMMLNHYTREMEEELEDAQEALLSQRAVERSALLRHREYARIAAELETKASEALAAGREADARAALADKLAFEGKAAQYLQWHEEAGARVLELEDRLEQAKEELERLREKRAELVARAEKAAAEAPARGEGFAAAAGGTIHSLGRSAMRGFERMEEKILQWESQAEARRSAPGYGAAAAAGYDAARVDEQLEALRRKAASE